MLICEMLQTVVTLLGHTRGRSNLTEGALLDNDIFCNVTLKGLLKVIESDTTE